MTLEVGVERDVVEIFDCLLTVPTLFGSLDPAVAIFVLVAEEDVAIGVAVAVAVGRDKFDVFGVVISVFANLVLGVIKPCDGGLPISLE